MVGRRPAGLLVAVMLMIGALCSPAPAAGDQAPPDNVAAFVKMLGDPEIQKWLQEQAASEARTEGQPDRAAVAQTVAGWIASMQSNIRELAGAAQGIGPELSRAAERVAEQSGGAGLSRLLVASIGLLGLGLLLRALVLRATSGLRDARLRLPGGAGRSLTVAPDVGPPLLGLLAFGAGALGPVLVFVDQGLWAEMLLSIVVPATAFMVVMVLSGLALRTDAVADDAAPSAADLRARHVRRWLVVAGAWFAFGYAASDLARLAGVSAPSTRLIAACLSFGLVLILLVAIWRTPRGGTGTEGETAGDRPVPVGLLWVASVYVAAGWVLWSIGATGLFWLLVFVLAVPMLLVGARRLVNRYFPGTEASGADAVPSLLGATVHACIRILIFGACLLALAAAWDVSLTDVTVSQTPKSRAARAIVTALVTVLAFDAIWQIVRTIIDLSLHKAARQAPAGSPLAIRNARLRTLLPIVRNLLLAFFGTLAVLMSLSALGIEIGPLLASAGVMGVAIGFGSQTLVKDVISGIFYLLDDAFRVGEYIVSGSYKGTVESFSLRSVRLRHHRGAVYTIPFGELGSVQNLSRDYTIEKMVLNVAYDADLEKARKIIKQIGTDLAADPELAPIILQPLKLQAISDFGEYGIQLKLKMVTRPGEQFAVRKKALPMIKKAFDENGIAFASPTVRVTEGEGAARAAAATLASKPAAAPVAAA